MDLSPCPTREIFAPVEMIIKGICFNRIFVEVIKCPMLWSMESICIMR
jgi:hypothetical protein